MNWCVLLTTTVRLHPIYQHGRNVPHQRLLWYLNVIEHWLRNTKLPIFVVESSGYSFDELRNRRLIVHSFAVDPERALKSSSQLEAESILRIVEQCKGVMSEFTHILKVTGRYYLENVSDLLARVPAGVDICLQHTHDPELKWQNSELFGFRRSLTCEIFKPVFEIGLMEHHLFVLAECYSRQYRFPPIHNELMAARGGDGLTIIDL